MHSNDNTLNLITTKKYRYNRYNHAKTDATQMQYFIQEPTSIGDSYETSLSALKPFKSTEVKGKKVEWKKGRPSADLPWIGDWEKRRMLPMFTLEIYSNYSP